MDTGKNTPDHAHTPERRAVIRIRCQSPLQFKVCKEETISKIMEGYTRDVSGDGLRCNISQEVPEGCTLWLQLDPDALSLCEEIEKRSVILQHGILGKVIWIDKKNEHKYEVGLQFIVREERDSLNAPHKT